jgi:hypothetical protein
MVAQTVRSTASAASDQIRFSVHVIGAALLASYALLFPWLMHLKGLNAALCILNITLAVIGFVLGWHPVARPIQTITFGFILAWLGVAPIYQLAKRKAAWGDADVLRDNDATIALILIAAALGALLLGFTTTRSLSIATNPAVAVTRTYAPWICLIACILLTPTAIEATGGLRAMFSSRSERASEFASQGLTLERVGGLQLALVAILPAALALVSTYLFLTRILPFVREHRVMAVPALDALAFVLSLGLLMLHDNPFIRTRFVAAGAAGALLLLILRPTSRRAGRRLAFITILATLIVYPLANVFRSEGYRFKSGLAIFASPDFDGFQQFINTIDLVRNSGYSFGHYTSSALLYFIPRSVWPGKALPASIDVAQHRGYVFTNLSLPLPAELFLEFTVVGMIVILFALGWRLGRMDNHWLYSPQCRDAVLVPYVAVAMLGILRGPVGSYGPVYFTIIGLLWISIRRVHHDTVPRPDRLVSREPIARLKRLAAK